VRAPSSFGAMALTYQTETRVVSIAEAPASAAGAIPPPNEAQLRTFYEESAEQLRVPEFRALTLVYARVQDFAARVDVPETRLREEFDARRAALTQPERRSYVRISAQNEAPANDIVARLGRGEAPDAIASALGVQVQRGADQARADVPDANVAEAVFAGSRGAARAVRGSLAPWVVVRVESITPSVAPDFAALRDELRQAIANDEAATMLNDAVREFEDARSGGASIADAARQHGFAVVAVPAIEAGGRDRTGAPVEALAGEDHAELLRAAFQTPEGEASDFTPAGDADVIVSVDSITPASVRPFAEVESDLRAAWISRERVRRLRELGQEVTQAVRGGQPFAAAARARGFSVVVQSRALDREMAAQIPARGLASQIFALRQGELANEIRSDGGAMLVAQIEEINRVNPAEEPQAVEAARAQASQGLIQSVATTLQSEIVRRARPQRNEQLLSRHFRRTGEGPEGEDQP
jgi:peptidyl-prolyl cis-trans isomerase D